MAALVGAVPRILSVREMIDNIRNKVGRFWRARARRLALPLGRVRSDAPARKVLFATDDNSILKSQIDPFRRYASQIFDRFGVRMHEVDFGKVVEMVGGLFAGVETVVLQPWFTIEPARLADVVDAVRAAGVRRVVFLDGYAPTDLRFAAVLDNRIDLYVKKHVLKDRSRYGVPTRGDTNLVEYYSGLYGIDEAIVHFPVSESFMSKLVVGPSFFTEESLWEKLHRGPRDGARDIDIHARLGVGEGWGWYSRMRRASVESLKPLSGRRVLTEAGVGKAQYMRELDRSKICFSPFGFGEIAWRDYEAIVSGSVLLKPDCVHLDIQPNIFRPGETYMPVRWDFEDVAEKAEVLLGDDRLRSDMAEAARAELLKYSSQGSFMGLAAKILNG